MPWEAQVKNNLCCLDTRLAVRTVLCGPDGLACAVGDGSGCAEMITVDGVDITALQFDNGLVLQVEILSCDITLSIGLGSEGVSIVKIIGCFGLFTLVVDDLFDTLSTR